VLSSYGSVIGLFKEELVFFKELNLESSLSYLGKYTHRIAISNYRLVKLEGETIFFKVRDQNSPKNSKVMSLNVVEFMRRFLLHVLPKGFVRIRHFRLLGNRYKKEKIGIIRKLQNVIEKLLPKVEEDWCAMLIRLTSIDPDLCPDCRVGKLENHGRIPLDGRYNLVLLFFLFFKLELSILRDCYV
jgi:hypothetical protein